MPNPIQTAANLFGGQASLARALGVSAPTVNQWINGDRTVPEERSAQIERLLGGMVTVEQIRPDARWIRIPDEAWPNARGRPVLDVAAPASEPLGGTADARYAR